MTKHGDIGHVGHVNLAPSMDDAAVRFIRLVEVLDRAGVRQHVIAANDDLARRVAIYPSVRVGPVTASAVIACCLMPRADVVHAHGEQAGHAGLLLALTRSIPYVMTGYSGASAKQNAFQQAVLRRSMGRVDIGSRLDADKVLRSYGRAVARWRAKMLLV